MPHRCAILDDYQGVALRSADWASLSPEVEVTVFRERLEGGEAIAAALRDFDILCLMRERTAFPRAVIEALPGLRLMLTTGMKNVAIDMAAAQDRGVVVCGTAMSSFATAELVFAHILEFARKIGLENARLKAGQAWQSTVGIDLAGKTLGVVGLGKLGGQVARIGNAFGMKVIAWSQNLTPGKAAEAGAQWVSREELFATADFISINLALSGRTRGLLGAADLARMKPTAFIVNTARAAILDEAALVEALREGRIAGAGIDVFDREPLPLDHPFRTLERAQISPHLGYVTEGSLAGGYGQIVEDIRAFLAGAPIRVITA